MSPTNDQQDRDNSGRVRRLVLLHTLFWGVLSIALLAVSEGDLHRLWMMPLGFVLPVLVLPRYLRFKRLALMVGYTTRQAKYEYFVEGMGHHELVRILKNRESRRSAWSDLLETVRANEPDLLQQIEGLQEIDNLEGARAVLERRLEGHKRNQQQHEERLAKIRADAEKHHCLFLVDGLKGISLYDIESLVDEARSLLERAKSLGLYDQVASSFLFSSGPMFGDARRLIKMAELKRELDRVRQALEPAIDQASEEHQPKLRQLLEELMQCEPGSREFRIIQHNFDVELAQANT